VASDFSSITSAGFTRRRLLQTGAALGALSLGVSLGSGRALAAAGVNLTQFIWTGAQEPVPRRLAAEYMKAHPDVQIDLIAGLNMVTYPKIIASLDIDPNDPAVNFGFFNLEVTAKGQDSKVWLPLDKKVVPNLDNILDGYRQPDDKGAFFCMDVSGILYNTDKIKTPPTSWTDLWKPEYKGRVAFFDYDWTTNGLIPTASLNGGSEDNIEPGMKIFAEAAKAGHIHSMFTSNSQLQQLLVSGEVWLAPYVRGVALPWAAQGAPIAYAVPKEGQIAFPEGFQMVRGSSPEQQKAAQEIINLSLEPDNVLDYCRTARVLPLMKNVKLPADLASDPAVQPDALKQAINLDYAKLAANNSAWTDLWNKEVKANLK
jgi:putative spermidine/putrescine transport system substrate-binding protein